MSFLYETHLHTSQGSACGSALGREHISFYLDHGFTGIILTDHFFGGNTAVPKDLPWRERINRFCSGYEDAWEEGQKQGLDVFFSWEQNFKGDEYLIYGLDKEWLLAHPEMEHWTRKEQLTEVHKYGGCVIQAHPFRKRDYIPRILLGLAYADGIEVANAGNTPAADTAALRYAKDYGLYCIAGSDNHASRPDQTLYGVELETKLHSIGDYVNWILNRKPLRLFVPEDRFDIPADEPEPDAYFLDENEQPVPSGRSWLR